MAILRVDALRTVAAGSITSSFTVLGSAITHLWRAFRVINNTDGDLLISFDGTTNNLFLPKGSFVLYDVTANASPPSLNDNFLVGIGTQLYVKYSTAPSMGAVCVEGIYAKGE